MRFVAHTDRQTSAARSTRRSTRKLCTCPIGWRTELATQFVDRTPLLG
jgi:hypothetical protein